MKKLVSMLLVVAMAVSLLAGCSSSTAETSGSASENAESTAVNEAEVKSMRFLDVCPSPVRQKYFEEAFAKFEAETGIAVTYESVPWDDAANKISMLATSGQLPDVMTTYMGWLGQFVPAGWIIPAEEYIADIEDEFIDAITKVTWKSERESYGSVYTIPDGLMIKGVFYRKDWAAEKGITIDDNWTWDDYLNVVEKMYDADKNQYGASYRGARGGFDPILFYMQSLTGGRTYDDEGNCLINTPECIEAFKKWTDVYKKGFVPKESINWGFVEMVDNFTGGLTGTIINDSEVAATCLNSMDDSQWAVAPMPLSANGDRLNIPYSSYSFTITRDAANKDTAWKLIEFLSRPENNAEYCKLTGMIPIKKAVSDDPLYGEDGPYAPFVKQVNDPKLLVPLFMDRLTTMICIRACFMKKFRSI